jgi:nucleoside-diphosphate-sugar epimerase
MARSNQKSSASQAMPAVLVTGAAGFIGSHLVSRIANSLKKRRRESTPYGVANARKVSNLAALCALSGADFAAFLFQSLLPRRIIIQRTNDSGH